MFARFPIPESSQEIVLTLDELAREGARRMFAAALRAEADDYVARSQTSSMRTGAGWWSATAAPASARR
jgi:hypothetical protein